MKETLLLFSFFLSLAQVLSLSARSLFFCLVAEVLSSAVEGCAFCCLSVVRGEVQG